MTIEGKFAKIRSEERVNRPTWLWLKRYERRGGR